MAEQITEQLAYLNNNLDLVTDYLRVRKNLPLMHDVTRMLLSGIEPNLDWIPIQHWVSILIDDRDHATANNGTYLGTNYVIAYWKRVLKYVESCDYSAPILK